ncbi:sulfatase-like hydrolase/transferase [Sphingobacterium sp. HJSM2_6]|uniref:sulfatase-like hydrolase/transferase n=1 Tax=Sphingobacterium sp. HJSM2_6 TaxID=3366264 RepID=UPI003BE23DC5
MTKVIFLLTCSGLLILFSTENGKATTISKDPKPNIIYILVDDMGIGDIGVYYQNYRKEKGKRNWPYMQTPQLDRLASRGARLDHGYVNAPVCVSSRASLLLGATQGHSKIRNNQFDKALDRNYNLANSLKIAGYNTAAIGKWGMQGKAPDWPAHPLKVGFDYYYGYIRHSDGHEHYPKEGKYKGVKEMYDNYTNVTADLDKCYTGDLWTARAKQWIIDYVGSKDKNTPFFMYLSYDTPHAVTELPTQQYPNGAGLKGGLQWLGKPGEMINTASGEIDSWIAPEYANATWDHDHDASTVEKPWPDVYKRYATSIKRIDDQVGDVLQLLSDLGIEDNTLLIFSSDNGVSKESYLKEEFSPEFFRSYATFQGIKRDLWEGGVRVPYLVQWPKKVKAGTIIQEPMIASDWLATFLDAAGLSIPANIDGVSILPTLTGSGKRKPSKIYMEYDQNQPSPDFEDFDIAKRNRPRGQMQSIRIGDYMGVRYSIKNSNDPFEIYDVVKDPMQNKNLAGTSTFDDLQKLMQHRVIQMRRPDENAKRPYDDAFVAASTEKNIKNKSFTCQLYEVDQEWVPNEYGLKSIKKKTIKTINQQSLNPVEDAVYVVTGFITVPTDGAYRFKYKSNGKAILKLHEILLIDADFDYQGETMEESVMLKAGKHPFTFSYKPSSSDSTLDFTWSGPSFDSKEIGF